MIVRTTLKVEMCLNHLFNSVNVILPGAVMSIPDVSHVLSIHKGRVTLN